MCTLYDSALYILCMMGMYVYLYIYICTYALYVSSMFAYIYTYLYCVFYILYILTFERDAYWTSEICISERQCVEGS